MTKSIKNFSRISIKNSYGVSQYHIHKHFSLEGQIALKGLLYIPQAGPKLPWMNQDDNSCNLKLYVKKVLLMENCRELVPVYLNFLTGVIDCEDLPLTVSREMLQESRTVDTIKKIVVKQALQMFSDLTDNDDKYLEFYNEYSRNIKAGYHDDSKNRDKYLKLLRFYTSTSTDKLISLENYVSNMKEGQPGIYYITGDSISVLKNSPYLEKLNSKGYEVLLMTDAIDEYVAQLLEKYGDIEFISVTKSELKFDNEKDSDSKETNKDDYNDLCARIEKTLTHCIEKVVISDRIVDSPCCIVSGMFGLSANMERIIKSQPMENTMTNPMLNSKKILEINVDHPLIQGLDKIKDSGSESDVNDFIIMLYETSTLNSGYDLGNPAAYSKRIFELMNSGLGKLLENSQVSSTSQESTLNSTDSKESKTDEENLENIAEEIDNLPVETDAENVTMNVENK